jgi:hypothetical protein
MKLKHHNKLNNINEYNELKYYIVIGLISFICDICSGKDKLYNNCKQPSHTFLLLFLHHIYASFIYFGWLSNHKNILILHLVSILITMLLQYNNDMRCPSTEMVNVNCNINRNNYMRDFLYFINFKKGNIYYIYVFLSSIISIVKLYNIRTR